MATWSSKRDETWGREYRVNEELQRVLAYTPTTVHTANTQQTHMHARMDTHKLTRTHGLYCTVQYLNMNVCNLSYCFSWKQASHVCSAQLAVWVPICSSVRLCEVKYCITYSHNTLWVKGVVTQQYILEWAQKHLEIFLKSMLTHTVRYMILTFYF